MRSGRRRSAPGGVDESSPGPPTPSRRSQCGRASVRRVAGQDQGARGGRRHAAARYATPGPRPPIRRAGEERRQVKARRCASRCRGAPKRLGQSRGADQVVGMDLLRHLLEGARAADDDRESQDQPDRRAPEHGEGPDRREGERHRRVGAAQQDETVPAVRQDAGGQTHDEQGRHAKGERHADPERRVREIEDEPPEDDLLAGEGDRVEHGGAHPDRAAFIMASSGEAVSYAEHEQRTNRLAHLLRARRAAAAGPLRDLHGEQQPLPRSATAPANARGCTTPASTPTSHADELAYIVDNSESQAADHLGGQAAGGARGAGVTARVSCAAWWSTAATRCARCTTLATSTSPRPPSATPARRSPTSGSARRCCTHRAPPAGPRASCAPLPENPPSRAAAAVPLPATSCGTTAKGMLYLSPAPLYHSAPQANVSLTIRNGGTVVIMEHFDPEQYLALIEQHRVTHIQLVPTMFSRMLKLPEARAPALRPVVAEDRDPRRGAVPGAGEGADDRVVGPDHPRVLRRHRGLGLHRLRHRAVAGAPRHGGQGAARRPARARRATCSPRPRASRASSGSRPRRPSSTSTTPSARRPRARPTARMSTVGDVGYVDDDGFLYLTDRSTFMIISRRRQHLPAGVREPADHAPARWPTRRCSACPTRIWARRSRPWCSRCPA